MNVCAFDSWFSEPVMPNVKATGVSGEKTLADRGESGDGRLGRKGGL
jgi:hypothetical protein